MHKVNTPGFIEIESSLNRVVVWYFRKNVDNVANYRAFLTSIESELIAKLCECTRIHPIKYNIKLEATYVVPNVANRAQNRAFKTSAKELYAHSNVAVRSIEILRGSWPKKTRTRGKVAGSPCHTSTGCSWVCTSTRLWVVRRTWHYRKAYSVGKPSLILRISTNNALSGRF